MGGMRIVIVSSTQWTPAVGDVAGQVAASWQSGAPNDRVRALRFSDGGSGFCALNTETNSEIVVCVEADQLSPGSLDTDSPDRGSSYVFGLGLARACETASAPLLLGLPPTQDDVTWADGGAGLLAGLAEGFGIGQERFGIESLAANRLLGGALQLSGVTPGDLPDLEALRARLHAAGLVVASRATGPLLGLGGLAALLDQAGRLDGEAAHRLERTLGDFAHLVAGALGTSLLGHNLLADPIPGSRPATEGDGVAVSVRARELTGQPGAGTYGGVGFMLNVLGVPVRNALDVSAERTGLEAELDAADVVVVVSTALDAAEVHDGATQLVANRALQRGVPVIALTGHSEAGRREWAALGVSTLYEPTDAGPMIRHQGDLNHKTQEADEQAKILQRLLARMPGIVRTWSR